MNFGLRFRTVAAVAGTCVLLTNACAPLKPKPGPSVPKQSVDPTVRLQIFLDSKNFGPGVVDGRGGEFTSKALDQYRQANGLAPDWQPDVSDIQPYTTYTVTADDVGRIGTMADGPAALAKQEKLPYTSLIELLSERFHTTQKFLRSLNPGKDINSLGPGGDLIVPDIARPLRVDGFPSTYPPPRAGVAAKRKVIVDTKYRMLQVLEGGEVIAAFPITPGSSAHPALPGELRVVGAVPWPWYRHDEGVLDRGERTGDFHNLPPGSNSPVGLLWTGLNRPGVGIHGTTTPDTIGRAGSHGCIRLSNWDAAAFYTLVQKDMPVTIR